jgi:hypothetical protein
MGINNRQRRAAKAKQRARRHARRSDRSGWQQSAREPSVTPQEAIRGLLQFAASADDADQLVADARGGCADAGTGLTAGTTFALVTCSMRPSTSVVGATLAFS